MELTTIKIAPEDIDQHIKAAVMNSAIGKSLEKQIAEKLRGWEFDKAVASVLTDEIPKIIRSILMEDKHKAMLTDAVRNALTGEVVLNITNKTIEHLWK